MTIAMCSMEANGYMSLGPVSCKGVGPTTRCYLQLGQPNILACQESHWATFNQKSSFTCWPVFLGSVDGRFFMGKKAPVKMRNHRTRKQDLNCMKLWVCSMQFGMRFGVASDFHCSYKRSRVKNELPCLQSQMRYVWSHNQTFVPQYCWRFLGESFAAASECRCSRSGDVPATIPQPFCPPNGKENLSDPVSGMTLHGPMQRELLERFRVIYRSFMISCMVDHHACPKQAS